jgi:HlyD family secretion protein
MRVSISSSPAQARQTRQQLANPEDSLSYELGKAVQELPPLYTRMVAGGISVLVVGTIGWAHFSKVDEVATAPGELIPSVQVRPVRALDVGTIENIKVKEGETVRKGDVIVELDPGAPEAEVARLQKAAKLIREDLARLEAERTGSSDAGTALQDQLLASRLQEFRTKEGAAISEAQRQYSTIEEAEVRLARLQENLVNAQSGLTNAQDRERSLRSLLTDGAVPRLDYIEARDRLTEAEDKVMSIAKEVDAQAQRVRQAREAYEGALNTANGLGSQRQSEILTQLTKRREELANVEGQLNQAKKQQEREAITSPVDGTVYNVKATKGPVQTGEELLSILPAGEDLVLEVKVLNRDIGFIKEGMRAKVKLQTFPYQEFGIVDGTVVKVSPNAVVDKDLGLVFPTRVKLNRQAMMTKGGKAIEFAPGMSGTAEIVTRQKTILTFLIEPVTRRFTEAFSVR